MDQISTPVKLFKLLKGLVALLKISATAVLAFILGVWLISFGDRQSIVTGCGAILVGTSIAAFVGYSLFCKQDDTGAALDGGRARNKAWKVVWFGVLFVLAPGLLYLYYCATMDRVDPRAIMFLAVPLEAAGLGMVVFGLWQLARR
jgi:hypothetical protein